MSISNKLDEFKDKTRETFFGDKKVKKCEPFDGVDAEGKDVPTDRSLIEYEDGTIEAVHPAEWEKGQSDAPPNQNYLANQWFVKRTEPMRSKIHAVIGEYNPRVMELKKSLDWVMEQYNQVLERCIALKFGVKDVRYGMTVKLVLDTLGDKAEKLPTDIEQRVVEILKEEGTNVIDIIAAGFFDTLLGHWLSDSLGDDKALQPVEKKIIDIIKAAGLDKYDFALAGLFGKVKEYVGKSYQAAIAVKMGDMNTLRTDDLEAIYDEASQAPVQDGEQPASDQEKPAEAATDSSQAEQGEPVAGETAGDVKQG